MSDKVVSNMEEFREAIADHDIAVRYEGRTLVVTCLFFTQVDPYLVSERVLLAARGPKSRMVFGGLSHRRDGYKTESYINTDESLSDVAGRMKLVDPCPAKVDVALVGGPRAQKLWTDFHRSVDGGD